MNAEIAIGYTIWLMFFVVSARDILYYLWLFQVKEYRIDRLRSYIEENYKLGLNIILLFLAFTMILYSITVEHSTKLVAIMLTIALILTFNWIDKNLQRENRSYGYFQSFLRFCIFSIIFLFYIVVIRIVYIILVNLSFFLLDLLNRLNNHSLDVYILIAVALPLIYFTTPFFRIIKEIKQKSLRHPQITSKIVLIFLAFIIIFWAIKSMPATSVFPFSFSKLESHTPLPMLIIINSLLPILITLAVILVNPISNWQKKKVIKAAAKKRKSLKHVRTIGITGSYGKTSTKEFLYAILSSKYKVIKTEGNNNTAMGVANTVLGKVSDDFDFFICEMGAYKIGEIKEICEIAQPEIGIITGINEQHIELFGSIENTKKAKFELLESLPETGMAIINKSTLRMKPEVKFRTQNIFLFSKELAQNISVTPDYVEFQYKEASFGLNALGAHYIGNLMSAIIVAEQLGMNLSEISAAVLKIEIKGRYLMQKISGPKNAVFIDDSYSANPDGVFASLEYVKTAYPDYKRIFVFPGIIELGKKSEEIHQRIWQKVNESFHKAYVIQKDNKDIQKKYTKCHFIFEKNFDKISQEVEKEVEEKTVVLFESRGAGVVMQKILNKK